MREKNAGIQAAAVKNAVKVNGFCIHLASRADTITAAEIIQSHFLNTTSLLRIISFGNKSASGRISITKATAYQLKSKRI